MSNRTSDSRESEKDGRHGSPQISSAKLGDLVQVLDQYQSRLETHFAAVAGGRRAQGLAVFAIEHGLSSDERESIGELLNRSLDAPVRPGRFWLVWIAYAAEQGYAYDGDEYWTTFERRTPNWRVIVDRRSLRQWFERFHEKFAGLKPTGPWASQFSIIAWPITHALLPRDLQFQLARALYQWRYQLAKMLGDGPTSIGEFLANMSGDAPSRFHNFLEQKEIVGRIVTSLLAGRAEAAAEFILPITLQRIVDDLQRVREARAWLRDARQVAERYQLKGVARHLANGTAKNSSAQPGGAEAHPYLRPALTLRRAAPDEWKVWAELPSLRSIADLSPDLSTYLRGARCSVLGSPGVLPPGWLMLGDQRRVLASWPPTDRSLVQFTNDPPPVLSQLLLADGCITTGPIWLFRVGADGLAHQVIGRAVRPGERYVLVSEAPLDLGTISRPTRILATGVTAVAFDLPRHLSDETILALRACGLGVGQSIRIAPAGLDARRWDGEGFAEYTEGENPCLSLEADHLVESFHVTLDSGPPLSLPSNAGGPVFVKLTDLEVGQHTISVEVRSRVGTVARATTGYIALTVRPPQTWITGTTNHNGLAITADPTEPSLDQFWNNEVTIQAYGPAHQQVTISVELLNSAGEVLTTEQVSTLPLPVTPEAWFRAAELFLKKDADPWAYLSAASGKIVVEGDFSGSWRLPLHRDIAPLRWVWHRSPNRTALRLIDDHGGNEPILARFFPFAQPAAATNIDTKVLESDFCPSGQGGLCVASVGDKCDAVVVSMPQTLGSLSSLVVEPKIAIGKDLHATIDQISKTLALWKCAKLVGPLAASRRLAVLRAFERTLVESLCGPRWAIAESQYLASRKSWRELKALVDTMEAPSAFRFVIARDIDKFRSMLPAKRLTELEMLARRYFKKLPTGAVAASIATAEWLDQGGPCNEALETLVEKSRAAPFLLLAARVLRIATGVPAPQEPHVSGHDQ